MRELFVQRFTGDFDFGLTELDDRQLLDDIVRQLEAGVSRRPPSTCPLCRRLPRRQVRAELPPCRGARLARRPRPYGLAAARSPTRPSSSLATSAWRSPASGCRRR
ncbi:MAG: hypothetical protein HY906_20755 [Deltaproteobacteria bacterium]|nr:hypothetical protein [Deltaproteobacteria bacterium]